MSWEVIISTNGGTYELYNSNNNDQIDIGERTRFWNRETRDEGNIFDDLRGYSEELHQLGIRAVPVGTKIRPLQDCIKILQQAISYAESGETLKIKNSVELAKRKARDAGIEIDPNLEGTLMKLAYQRAIDVFLTDAEEEIEAYSKKPRYTQRDMDIAINPLGCEKRREIRNILTLANRALLSNPEHFSSNYYDIVGELVFKAREYAAMSGEVISEQRIFEISAAFYRNILCPQSNLAAMDIELLMGRSVVFICNANQLPAIF